MIRNNEFMVSNEKAAAENRERNPHKLHRHGTHPGIRGLSELPLTPPFQTSYVPKNIVEDTKEISPWGQRHNWEY